MSIPATLLTPYGIPGWLLPLRLLFGRIATDNLYARTIAEFKAPFGAHGFTPTMGVFLALAAVVLAAGIAAAPRARPADLLVTAAFLGLALLARRNIPLFALVALAHGAPLVAAAIGSAGETLAARPPGAARAIAASIPMAAAPITILAAILLTHAIATNRYYARDSTQRCFGRGEAPGVYPGAAASLVRDLRIDGEVLHPLGIGGFLASRWFPDRRIFIDGRLEVHDAAVYSAYVRLLSDPQFFEEVARRYDITAVLWSHRESAPAGPLLRHLAAGHGWRPIYVDASAMVFTRDAPGARPPIDLDDPAVADRLLREIAKAKERSRRADPVPAGLRRFVPRMEIPIAEAAAGIGLAAAGASRNAERLFRRAIGSAPGNALLHYDLGLVLAAQGRDAEAADALESAVRLEGRLGAARAALGMIRMRRGDAQGALAEWSAAESTAPLDPAILSARAGLLARLGRIDEAIDDLRRAARIRPGDPAPLAALGRLRAARGEREEAERLYRRALVLDAASIEALLGLALLEAGRGRRDDAAARAAAALRAGADPAVVLADPALRDLAAHPDIRPLLQDRPSP